MASARAGRRVFSARRLPHCSYIDRNFSVGRVCPDAHVRRRVRPTAIPSGCRDFLLGGASYRSRTRLAATRDRSIRPSSTQSAVFLCGQAMVMDWGHYCSSGSHPTRAVMNEPSEVLTCICSRIFCRAQGFKALVTFLVLAPLFLSVANIDILEFLFLCLFIFSR